MTGLLDEAISVLPLDPVTKTEVTAAEGAIKIALWVIGVLIVVGFTAYFVMQIMGYQIGKAQQKTETAKDGQVAAVLQNQAQAAVTTKDDGNAVVLGQLKDKLNAVSTKLAQLPHATDALPSADAASLRGYDDSLCASRPTLCVGRSDSGPTPNPSPAVSAPVVSGIHAP